MVIFHCYVSSPEGIQDDISISICGMIWANVQTEQGTRKSEIVYSDELFSMLYAISIYIYIVS